MSPLHWGRNAKQLDESDLSSLKQVTVDVSLLIGKKI
jgi:23S rRNA (guanine745-N1)-methyltransferase